jgi:hypothetical protein
LTAVFFTKRACFFTLAITVFFFVFPCLLDAFRLVVISLLRCYSHLSLETNRVVFRFN